MHRVHGAYKLSKLRLKIGLSMCLPSCHISSWFAAPRSEHLPVWGGQLAAAAGNIVLSMSICSWRLQGDDAGGGAEGHEPRHGRH